MNRRGHRRDTLSRHRGRGEGQAQKADSGDLPLAGFGLTRAKSCNDHHETTESTHWVLSLFPGALQGAKAPRAQRGDLNRRVSGKGLDLVDDSLGQLDTTEASTLQDFIRWGNDHSRRDDYYSDWVDYFHDYRW